MSMEQFPKKPTPMRAPQEGQAPEKKEQMKEGFKLTYLSPNRAFFEDAEGNSWSFDAQANTFEEEVNLDPYKMNVQFDTTLPIEQNQFKNKEEALEYVHNALFKDHIKSGIKDMHYQLGHSAYSKDLIPVITEMLNDYETIQQQIDSAKTEQDPVKKKELEQGAYNLYLEKYSSSNI